MAYKPTFPSPYMEAIDVSISNGIIFKCLVNPRDIVTDYLLTINNAGNGKKVYDTFQTLDSPLCGNGIGDSLLEASVPYNSGLTNGCDYIWNIMLFNDAKKFLSGNSGDFETAILSTDGSGYICYKTTLSDSQIEILSKIKQGYLFLSKSANGAEAFILSGEWDESEKKLYFSRKITGLQKTDMENNTYFICDGISSNDFFFRARKNFELTLDVPSTVNSIEVTATGTYTQEQNIGVSYYKFNLYSGAELIDSTGVITSSNIIYNYSGLENEKSYTLELILTDDEKRQQSVSKDFVVSYGKYSAPVRPQLFADESDMSVDLDFSKNVSIIGSVEGTQGLIYKKFKNSNADIPQDFNAVSIDKDQCIYWDNVNETGTLDIENTIQILHWHGHEGFYGIIAEVLDNTNLLRKISVKYTGDSFYYKIGNGSFVEYNPYSETLSAIGTEDTVISDTALYELNDTDELSDTDYLLSNDISNKYWWIIIIYPNKVKFCKSKKYDDTVVSE